MSAKIILSLFIILLWISGCSGTPDCFIGPSGSVIEVERSIINIDSINRVQVYDDIDVDLFYEPNAAFIRIEADKNLVDMIEVKQVDNELFIRNLHDCRMAYGYQSPRVQINLPSLKRITTNGYGDVFSRDTLRYSFLEFFNFAGSGDFYLTLNTEAVNFISRLRSNFYVSGYSKAAVIVIRENDGQFNGENFKVDSMNAEHSGTNFINVFPIRELWGTLQYGKINLYNTPDQLRVNVIGNRAKIINLTE